MQATAASTHELAAAMHELWRAIMRGGSGRLYGLIAELDLSLTQIKALHALEDCGCAIPVKELAERLGLSLPQASRLAEALLRRGLLERREDAEDRRMKRLTITPAGRDIVRQLDSARLEGLEAWAATLTPEQRTALLAAIPQENRP